MSVQAPVFENGDTTFCMPMLPTEMARPVAPPLEAGSVVQESSESFPEATTTCIPASTAVLMANCIAVVVLLEETTRYMLKERLITLPTNPGFLD